MILLKTAVAIAIAIAGGAAFILIFSISRDRRIQKQIDNIFKSKGIRNGD